MKIMILDGSSKDDNITNDARHLIEKYFRQTNCDVNTFILRDLHIAPCRGFFGCWLKTPGICIINDAGRDITKTAALSDYWIFLTPITFGGYSAQLKKAVDRMAPLMLAYFMKVKGEVHHKPRYGKHYHLIVFGSTKKNDLAIENVFKTLVHRNSVNFHCEFAITKIISLDDNSNAIEDMVNEVFGQLITK